MDWPCKRSGGAIVVLSVTLLASFASAQQDPAVAPAAPAQDAAAPPGGDTPPPEKPPTRPATSEPAPDQSAPSQPPPAAAASPQGPHPASGAEEQPSPEPAAREPAPAEPAVTSDAAHPPHRIVYTLERVEIRGNHMRESVIRGFVPLAPGDLLDVDDPAVELVRFRLIGTGWFDDVRLTLEKGRQRGWVVLVIEVEERNTLTVSRVVAGLSRVVTSSRDRDDSVRPYGGLGLTESNLFGSGIGIGASAVVSEHQFGLDLRYHDPVSLGAGYDLNGRLLYNDAREFFGRDPQVTIGCPLPEPGDDDECDQDVERERAVVIYERGGVGLGTGNELTGSLRYELDWLGEIVDVGVKPAAASTVRGAHGEEQAPIDFRIDDGQSFVSSLHGALIFDTRDDPALPARGHLLRIDARVASGLFGSTYDFARFEGSFRQFFRLPWGHVLSGGLFAGSVVGRAPFFYLFYAADLSDLLPSRVLELNLDHRRTHNLLDTSIKEHNKEEVAARVDFEYQLPLHRGTGDLRGIDAYAGAGLFLLSSRDALRVSISGYEGLSRIPVDLTFDLGVQADTAIGLFKVGLSSVVAVLPDLGQDL